MGMFDQNLILKKNQLSILFGKNVSSLIFHFFSEKKLQFKIWRDLNFKSKSNASCFLINLKSDKLWSFQFKI